ncbi:MAG TPA: hypothetical protein VJZ27_06880 [Aggregatilineales bacterium]|nr:hypothetical protein [Aggregatilineales bacterium]
MDLSLYLLLIIILTIVIAVAILMNTSILWNQNLHETWNEIRHMYFGRRNDLDDTPNPLLKDLPPDDAECESDDSNGNAHEHESR